MDHIEAAEASDLTGFAPRERELSPRRTSRAAWVLLPWFRNAGVARVLSLDPLSHGDLVPLAADPGRAAGRLDPRLRPQYLAPRLARLPGDARGEARRGVARRTGRGSTRGARCAGEGGRRGAGRRPSSDLHQGRAAARLVDGGEERYEVEANASAYLVVRPATPGAGGIRRRSCPSLSSGERQAPGGRGQRGGRHEVVLRYEAPGSSPASGEPARLVAAAVLFVASGGEG